MSESTVLVNAIIAYATDRKKVAVELPGGSPALLGWRDGTAYAYDDMLAYLGGVADQLAKLPVPCHYCNMLVTRDREGGIVATNPAVIMPWNCPASSSGRHLIAKNGEAS
jgi:hypothetical protein